MKRCLAKITTCYNVEILAQHFLAIPSALRSLQPGCLEGTEPGTFAGDPLLGAMGIECRMVEYQSRRGFLSPASARFAGAPAPPASSRIDDHRFRCAKTLAVQERRQIL